MRKTFLVGVFLTLFWFPRLIAHEEHHGKEIEQIEKKDREDLQEDRKEELEGEGGRPKTWLQWIGHFHFIFLHFPIALINMAAVAEVLSWRLLKKKGKEEQVENETKKESVPLESASRFMLISAAILTPFTALLGLLLSYSVSYSGLDAVFIWWHMWFGLVTAFCMLALLLIWEFFGKEKLYYSCLALVFLLVNMTGFFGGELTFGPFHMIPPSLF